ncbi:MAG: hypothetical protein AAF480_09035 [Actinomycetota bacterium]
METMVLLVFLGIVWAAVGIYWLRTRMPALNVSVGSYARRLGTLDAMQPRRPADALAPLRAVGGNGMSTGVTELRTRTPAGPPGHSLTAPARAPQAGSGPARSVSSEQARLRRRNVLVTLACLAALTLIGVFTIGGTTMILLHLVADALLLGFVMLLVQYQRAIELDRTRNLPVYAAPRDQQLLATGTDGRWR